MHYKFQTLFSLWLTAWLSLWAPGLVLAQAKDIQAEEIDVQKIKAPRRCPFTPVLKGFWDSPERLYQLMHPLFISAC